MENNELEMLLKPGQRVHLIGAGGVSMSALAEVLQRRGLQVTGSDRSQSEATERLKRLGIPIVIGEDASLLAECDAVIRTAAAREDNPEVAATRRLGMPLLERAEAWGVLMREYRHAICVAGTHGKTTTTGMLAHIAMEAGIDPTVMLGGRHPLFNAGHRIGKGDVIILESCEYCNSYHHFSPNTALFLNIESDHLDFFSNMEEIMESFGYFANLVPSDGILVGNREDKNVCAALEPFKRVLWFGLGGDVTAENIRLVKGCQHFDVVAEGRVYTHVSLKAPGEHNGINALAAAATSYALKWPGEAVQRGLAAFTGVGRRMEYVGMVNGAVVYDDYAHHPTEIKATLKTAQSMTSGRTLCVFQPHTYTRTKALFNDFAQALAGCDKLYLAPIYAARENDPGNLSSDMLAKEIPGAKSYNNFEDISRDIRAEAKPNDIIITAGAGDIFKVARMLAQAL